MKQPSLFGDGVKRDAVISNCQRYRYKLVRRWDDTLPLVLFVGLNPSTADSMVDDHTCKKWMHFARLWGCGGFIACNLFAYRATDPAELERLVKLGLKLEAVGDRTDRFIYEAMEDISVSKLVACWGASIPEALRYRALAVYTILSLNQAGLPVQCFGTTATGDPKHPLTLSYATPLQVFRGYPQ